MCCVCVQSCVCVCVCVCGWWLGLVCCVLCIVYCVLSVCAVVYKWPNRVGRHAMGIGTKTATHDSSHAAMCGVVRSPQNGDPPKKSDRIRSPLPKKGSKKGIKSKIGTKWPHPSVAGLPGLPLGHTVELTVSRAVPCRRNLEPTPPQMTSTDEHAPKKRRRKSRGKKKKKKDPKKERARAVARWVGAPVTSHISRGGRGGGVKIKPKSRMPPCTR